MKIVSKIVAVCCLWALSSCDGYLDVNQPSIYTDQNLYKSPADCEAAIAGVYSQLQVIYNRNYLEAIILREDAVKNMNNNITRFSDTSTDKAWETSWKSLWVMVARSNEVLSKIDKVVFTDEDQKTHIKGEAYAMRGLAYLQFAWCWGGSPLVTTDQPLAELRKVKRSSQEETYGQAIKDLELAYEMLPEKRSGAEVGRATKYAMAGMLGRTYMYMRDYTKAAEWLSLIVGKEPALYKMATTYEDCFDDKFDNTSERVWEVQYVGGSTGKALGISQSFNSWLVASNINLKKDTPFLHNITFTGPSGSAQVSETIWGEGVYEEGDIRRVATMVNNLYYDRDYQNPDIYTGRKFLKATGTKPGAIDEWGNNISILRYTDVKLMYAEALNELGYAANLTQILSIINEVRKRAGLTPTDATQLNSKQATFDYLVHERFVEFCYEGLRWPDLIRWGLAEEAMEKHFALKNEGFNTATQTPMYAMDKRNLLAPIPQAEINAYGDKTIMWQNDGY